MVEEVKKPIQIRFGEKYSQFFDEIINCELANRKSDGWFIEQDKPMIKPRPGTIRTGNTLTPSWDVATAYVIGDIVTYNNVMYKATAWSTWSTPPSANWTVFTWGTSKQYFSIDRLGVSRHFRAFNNKLYYLLWTTWTFLKDIGTVDIEFSSQRAPVTIPQAWNSATAYVVNNKVILGWIVYRCILGHTNQTPPNVTYWVVSDYDGVQYTVAAVSSGAEKIKKATTDPLNSNNNVGKIIMITNGVYKGCYASIISYDTAWAEYTLGWSGAITAPPATTTYKIFDTITDVMMVCRGSSSQEELFFDGITELTWFQGYSTASLRQVAAIGSTQTITKMINFQNQCWTFNGGTLYYTGWYPGNPFFFNFTTALTVGGNGSISDIFNYKSRIVVNGTSFLFSIPTTLIIDRHITSYGAVKDAYINTGDDVYIFTTQNTLVSLNETIAWVVQIKNVGEQINNYLSTFKSNIVFGTDSKKIYIYGQENSTTSGIMCVLDSVYKTWGIYSGLRPSSIVSNGWFTYITDNNTDIVRRFSPTIVTDTIIGTDLTTTFEQSITLKEIDLNDIFSPKVLTDVYIAMENYTQAINVDAYIAINNKNWQKKRAIFTFTEIPVWGIAIWEWLIWENIFGSWGMLSIMSVPIMKHIAYANDPSNSFKIQITWVSGSQFYLNQIDIMVQNYGAAKTYFDASNTK